MNVSFHFTEPKPFAFGSGARVEFIPKAEYLRDKEFQAAKKSKRRKRSISIREESSILTREKRSIVSRQKRSIPTQKISFSIRTVAKNGLLFHSASTGRETRLMLIDGQLTYGSTTGAATYSASITGLDLATGRWQDVSMTRIGA